MACVSQDGRNSVVFMRITHRILKMTRSLGSKAEVLFCQSNFKLTMVRHIGVQYMYLAANRVFKKSTEVTLSLLMTNFYKRINCIIISAGKLCHYVRHCTSLSTTCESTACKFENLG